MLKIKEKSKKKKEEIKLNKASKTILIICIVVLSILILLGIIGMFSTNIQYYIWKLIIIPINSIVYTIVQFFVLKIGFFTTGIVELIAIILFPLAFYYENVSRSKKLSKKEKTKLINKVRIPEFILITILFSLLINSVILQNNNPKMDQLYFKSKVNKEYTLKDIEDTIEYLENKVIDLSSKQIRDKDGYIIYDSLEKTAINDLKKASNKYDILYGIYPIKYYKFDNAEYSTDPSTAGLTAPNAYNVGISYDESATSLLNTITHELCHTRGIMRENEAVLCSTIAGIESDNELSNYAAYLELYNRFIDAYYKIEAEKAKESEKRMHTLCTNNGYKEICDNLLKDTNAYVDKSEELVLVTFELNTYSKEFLNNMFDELKNYKYELYIGEEQVTEEILFNDSNSSELLTIKIKNSKKTFEQLKPFLKDNKDKLLSIRQTYSGMYSSPEMNREEALEYYLSPIPETNFIDSFNEKKMVDIYDYSRVVRLALEYFDYNNIK